MKYVLVQWSSGNIKSSILTENYVRDKSMLYDCTKEGVISFVTVQRGDVSTVKNKGKLGRIACVSDDRKLLEEHQNLLLAEESEFIEDDNSMSITRSSKRPRLQNGVDEEEEDLSSVTGLKLKVSKLVQELSAEQAKVEELQELNQTLQKGLPDLLQKAIQSNKLITQLRTCPNCKECYGTTEGDPYATMETTNLTQDELPTSNSTMETNLPLTISNITYETSKVYTSPLNTPSSIPHISMVASPSIVSVHSNAASPPSTPDNELAITLPSMLASDAGCSLPRITSAESLKIIPLGKSPNYNNQLILPKPGSSTNEKLTCVTPLEATYAGTYRKMTLALLTNFFDNEVLKVSSVTGKGETGKEGRKALDKDTVQYIIDNVQTRFPGVTPKEIKATMAQKCKYLRQPKKRIVAKINADDDDESTED